MREVGFLLDLDSLNLKAEQSYYVPLYFNVSPTFRVQIECRSSASRPKICMSRVQEHPPHAGAGRVWREILLGMRSWHTQVGRGLRNWNFLKYPWLLDLIFQYPSLDCLLVFRDAFLCRLVVAFDTEGAFSTRGAGALAQGRGQVYFGKTHPTDFWLETYGNSTCKGWICTDTLLLVDLMK